MTVNESVGINMKTYLSDVIPAIRRQSKKLNDVTVLQNVHWRLVDEGSGSRVVYIFRDQNELLISKNGEVEKGRWEYLGKDSLLIEIASKAYLFKQGFYNDYVLGLKKDGINEYAVLINEEKVEKEVKSIEDLQYVKNLLGSAKIADTNEVQYKPKHSPKVKSGSYKKKSTDSFYLTSFTDKDYRLFLTIFFILSFFILLFLSSL